MAHWIEDVNGTYTGNRDTWECSECHEPFTLTEGTPEDNCYHYCPNCGAKMDEQGADANGGFDDGNTNTRMQT